MIRWAVFIIGFVLGFSVEMRVEAGERVQLIPINPDQERSKPLSSVLLEEPRGCLATKLECAIRVGNQRRLQFSSSKDRVWTLGENTILVRMNESRIRLVEGSMRLQGSSTVVETELGEITVVDEAFVERRGESLILVNTGHAPVLVKGRGWTMKSEVPSGHEVMLDLPNVKTGKTSVNFPLPLDYDKQVVREARFFEGPKGEFAARLEFVANLRTQAAIVSSGLHQEIVERKLASIETRESELRKRRLVREAKDRELRALFRRKVLNPE